MRPDIPSATWVGHPYSWTADRLVGQPSVIFMHTTEGGEGRTSAEDGAVYDKNRRDGTSTHLFIDPDSTAQEVEFKDEAHAARRHGNDVGIQIEICGKAGQTIAQWDDDNSRKIVQRAIQACYEIRKLYGRARFPLVNLTPAQLRAGQHGFAEHLDATLAWPEDGGTHTDPGPAFPWARLFSGIRALEALEEEDEMSVQDAKQGFAEAIASIATVTNESEIDDSRWGGQVFRNLRNVINKAVEQGPLSANVAGLEAEVVEVKASLARIEASIADFARIGILQVEKNQQQE